MIAADGGFMYTPPAGVATGSDTYTYTLNDGNGVGGGVPTTDNAVVTFTLNNLIWFIDNSAGAGDGRLGTPFNSLAAFNAGSAAAGDIVYIEHTGTNYTGGIVLANNERLFGEGHSGGANLSNVLNFTLAPFSKTLPALNTANRPVITNAAGNGITLAQNNAVRGLEVGAVTGGAKISGSSFGTLTVGNTTTPDVILTGGGKALDLTTGSFDATSKFVSITTTSSGDQGIELAGIGGTIAFGSSTVSGATTQGILIGTSTGNIDLGNTSVSGGSNGVSLQNNSAGTRTFGTLNISGTGATAFLHGAAGGTTTAGATTITNPAAGGSGIDIQSSTTAVTFGNTAVTQSSPPLRRSCSAAPRRATAAT